MAGEENRGGRRTSQYDSGLSFEAEPTGLDPTESQEKRDQEDPGRASPRADFTPGSRSSEKSPAAQVPVSTILIAVAVLVLIVIAAAWLF